MIFRSKTILSELNFETSFQKVNKQAIFKKIKANTTHHHQMNSNPPSHHVLSSPQLLHSIFAFFSIQEVTYYTRVSKKWQEAAKKYFQFLKSFTVNTAEDIEIYLSIVNSLAIQEFSFISSNYIDISEVLSLLKLTKPTVQTLSFLYDNDNPEDLSLVLKSLPQAFPSVKTFKYMRRELNEIDVLSFKGFQHLKELYILGDCYFEGKYLSLLNPLETLVIHSHFVKYSFLEELLKASQPILKNITLDLEDYEEEEITKLILILQECGLSSLDLKYCNYFTNDHMMMLESQLGLKKLSLRKVADLSSGTCLAFFQHKFQLLEKIKIPMNDFINSACLVGIARQCENLRVLDLTWCEGIKDSAGIYEVFLNCKQLEKIWIVGVKKASEEAFPVIKEYYQQNKSTKIAFLTEPEREKVRKELINIREKCFGNHPNFSFYKKLKFLDATKCDFIPDDVFLMLLLINPTVDARNYYEETVSFPKYIPEINYDHKF